MHNLAVLNTSSWGLKNEMACFKGRLGLLLICAISSRNTVVVLRGKAHKFRATNHGLVSAPIISDEIAFINLADYVALRKLVLGLMVLVRIC